VPKALGNWDFNLKSSPNFAINYFGYGNNSLNNELNGMDYNRVRIRMLKLIPQKKIGYGSTCFPDVLRAMI
jgi:hypothetical protein